MKWWNSLTRLWNKRYQWNNLVLSFYPIATAMAFLTLMLSTVYWFKAHKAAPITFSFLFLGVIIMLWFLAIDREDFFAGEHSKEVSSSIKWSMGLFIFSEFMFFLSFFWTFFHSALSPSTDFGMVWPPVGIIPVDPLGIPLFNTALLVSSSFTAGAAHFWASANNKTMTSLLLGLTILLGAVFIFMQGFEYWVSGFSMSDSTYGSVFFIATGFHGLHVMAGTIFLLVCLFRILSNRNSCKKYIAMELSFWYWHFVDAVWIGLFMFVYVWG